VSDLDTRLVVDRICDKLRDEIVSGAIAPGTVINSVDIARQFGTSRTPVREALLILSQDGLVSMSNYRRPRVTQVSVEAIRALYGFREAIHAYIATSLVKHAPDGDLTLLHAKAVELLGTTDGAAEAHMRGIEAYLADEVRLCGNEVVADVLGGLKFKIRWFRRVGMPTPEQFLILAQDRLRAAEAYLERDALLAEAINRAMVRKGATFCEQNFVQTMAAHKLAPSRADG
jgi:DNA-binding GntR family transcriptional regulator